MENLVPLSASTLQNMKTHTDKMRLRENITKLITPIYNEVTKIATESHNTIYNHKIEGETTNFVINNWKKIKNALEEIFPKCTISYKVLSKGVNGNMYDTSDNYEIIKPFIDHTLDENHIVIDWSLDIFKN